MKNVLMLSTGRLSKKLDRKEVAAGNWEIK